MSIFDFLKDHKVMNVLVACEESQTVCKAFRAKGHRAFSADIQECSGGHPEWHIHADVLPILNGACSFKTQDGKDHFISGKWDLIIAHPPCTHLCVSGARHFEKKRSDGRQREGLELFCKFLETDCERVCIENPINIVSGEYVRKWFPDIAEKYGLPLKASQTVSPHQFGSKTRKATHYWLKGLPPLVATKIVEPELIEYQTKKGKRFYSKDYCIGTNSHSGKQRSKTYPGIAEAMADQWG